jgi:hypothetical protein
VIRLVADRFELLEKAGAGGMGEIYRAHDRERARPVALKVLRAEATDQRARFVREAEALATIRHEAVVGYVAHGADGGEIYLAMEWLEGRDLAARLRGGPLTAEETIALGVRLAGALGAVHAARVIHRDVKPSNVFLPDDDLGRATLLDLGVARITDRTGATVAGSLVGTPAYMSPEQARGDAELDARSDLFSLGALLFECLVGKPAFGGEHPVAVLAKVLFEDPPPLDGPGWLAEQVARLLAKEPASRPASAADVAQALLAGAGVSGAARIGTRELKRLFVVIATTPGASPAEVAVAETAAPVASGESDVQLERLFDGSVVAAIAAPGSAADGAIRAARCAIALRGRLPGTSIAIASGRGEVAARVPIGDVIDRVAALVKRAPPGRILVDETCASLLAARFVIVDQELGAEQLTTRTLLGRPTPCVGRDRELGTLTAALEQSRSEPAARALLVTAPPGYGKSRLRHELLARAGDGEVWLAAGDPVGAGSAFGLVGQLVRRAAGVREGLDPAEARGRLTARVARHLGEVDGARATEFLGELAGVPFPDDHSLPLAAARQNAQLMGDQMLRAWEGWLAAETAAQPVVIVIEDLHWGDVPSVRYLDRALRRLAEAPLFIAAFARPEVHDVFPDLWRERGVEEIHLAELSRKACERLARHVLGDRDEAIARIVALSAGNSFYLEELIRAVAAGKTELPESVLAMAQVRYEALEPEARQLLRAASVFGGVFWAGGVRALTGGAGSLEPLAQAELIERHADSSFQGETEYAFRHVLLREAAYAALTDSDRATGHRLAAAWLEAAGESDAMTLAGHLERGGEPARAAGWIRRAAEQALEGGDFDAALARVARARELGDRHEDLDILELEALKWRGEGQKMGERAASIVRESAAGSRPWYRALPELAFATADLTPIETALAALEPTTDRLDWITCTSRVISSGCIRLLHERVAPLFAKLDRLAAAAPLSPVVDAWRHQAYAFRATAIGDLARAISEFAISRAAFEAAGDTRNALAQALDRAETLAECGLLDEAEREIATVAPQTADLPRLQPMLEWLFVRVHFVRGRYAEARAAADWPSSGHPMTVVAGKILLALIDLEEGKLVEAERKVQEAIAFLDRVGYPMSRPYELLALILARQGRHDEAARVAIVTPIRDGVLVDSISGPPIKLYARAETARLAGDDARARELMAESRRLLHEMAVRISDEQHREAYLTLPYHRRILAP